MNEYVDDKVSYYYYAIIKDVGSVINKLSGKYSC